LEVRGDWRKLRDKKRHDLYSSPGIFRVKLAGDVSRIGGEGKSIQNVDGVTCREDEAWNTFHRSKDNTKIDIT
jgi:hypothetical protein